MLTKTNNCWKFKSEQELNDFLNRIRVRLGGEIHG